MNLIVPENYSLLNCHIHDKKSNILKGCDLFSAPIRSVLGGRNIHLKAKKRQDKSSLIVRVMTVFAVATIYYVYSPLLLIPIAAFSVKCVVSLFDETEIRIKEDIAEIFAIANSETADSCDYRRFSSILNNLGNGFLRPGVDMYEVLAAYEILHLKNVKIFLNGGF